MQVFANYKDAYSNALSQARKYNRDMSIAGSRHYNKKVFTVEFAVRRDRAFGHDLNVEIVKPTDPRTD